MKQQFSDHNPRFAILDRSTGLRHHTCSSRALLFEEELFRIIAVAEVEDLESY